MLRLNDVQWEQIRDHFPEEHIPEGRPGRKPVAARAILLIAKTGVIRIKVHKPHLYVVLQYGRNRLDGIGWSHRFFPRKQKTGHQSSGRIDGRLVNETCLSC